MVRRFTHGADGARSYRNFHNLHGRVTLLKVHFAHWESPIPNTPKAKTLIISTVKRFFKQRLSLRYYPLGRFFRDELNQQSFMGFARQHYHTNVTVRRVISLGIFHTHPTYTHEYGWWSLLKDPFCSWSTVNKVLISKVVIYIRTHKNKLTNHHTHFMYTKEYRRSVSGTHIPVSRQTLLEAGNHTIRGDARCPKNFSWICARIMAANTHKRFSNNTVWQEQSVHAMAVA